MKIWPVDFEYLSAGEIKQIRLTRKEMGLFFGASWPHRYMHNLVKRNPRLPAGRVQIIIADDQKQYKALTYDLSEIYAFALVSALPKAKAFLTDYSKWLSKRTESRQFKEKPNKNKSFFTGLFLRLKPFIQSVFKRRPIHQ